MVPRIPNFYSQVGFIDFLVAPLFDAWVMFSRTEFTTLCLSNLAYNRSMWVLHADDPDLLPGVPPNDFEKLDTLLDIIIPSISFGKITGHRQRSLSGSTGSTHTPKRSIKNPDLELHRILEKEDDMAPSPRRHYKSPTPINL
jgi:hypothetical protein